MKKEYTEAEVCPYCGWKTLAASPKLGYKWTTCPECDATIQGVVKRKTKAKKVSQ